MIKKINKKTKETYLHKEPIYIVFTTWCYAKSVYAVIVCLVA